MTDHTIVMDAPDAAPPELLLRMRGPGEERPRACRLRLPSDATVGEIVSQAAIAGVVRGLSGSWEAAVERTGRRAGPHTPVAELRLVHGDCLTFSAGSGATAGGGRGQLGMLEVVGGPAGGRRIAIHSQTVSLGRSEGDILIDDPSLSRRHLRITRTRGGWAIEDLGSRNGTRVAGASLPANRAVALEPGAPIEAGRSQFILRPADAGGGRAEVGGPDGTIGFNRPPRLVPPALERTLEPPEPPERPRRPRLPIIASIIPVIGGVALFLITKQPLMLAFCLLAPLMALGTYASDRWSGRSDFRRARARFEHEVGAFAPALEQARRDEAAERLAVAPDAAALSEAVTRLDERLWCRRPEHPDYLQLRLGLADQPSLVRAPASARGDEELRAELAAAAPPETRLSSLPAVVQLREAGVVGICGPPELRQALVRWLILQLAVLHSPRDLQVGAVVGPRDEPAWEWLKWLPHVQSVEAGNTRAGAIATTRLGVSELLASAADVLQSRAERQGGPSGPDLVLSIDAQGVEDPSAAAGVLAAAPAGGVFVLWHADQRADLPGECRFVVELAGDRAAATLTDTQTRAAIDDIAVDGVPADLVDDIAASLAPVRDVGQTDRGLAALPTSVSLAALEELEELDGSIVSRRWRHAGRRDLRLTLGAAADGPFRLDLADHGPHALIGGTTNAGKSELLRSLLASLALRYSPQDVTFLLVDYKGGAAFRELRPLPHTVGVVTDLDEHLAHRALVSLSAEIRQREHVLNDHGAIDIGDLAQRAPEVVLPRLLIVVDEFATLVQQIPDFVEGMIDVVQRGRSLGVHLILATQSPRGSVTGRIRANTGLAIALRTVSRDESSDIIGTADAAAIPARARGRAWARFGERDLVAFQAAYVGGSTLGRRVREVEVERFSIAVIDRDMTVGGVRLEPGSVAGKDLDVIVDACVEAARSDGRAAPRPPWVPALQAHVPLDTLADLAPEAFALIDEPEHQRVRPLSFVPEEHGSMAIIGAPRSGRTSTLAAIAAALARTRPPELLNVFGLDAAGRALSPVQLLPHCGSVVPADDAERTARLLLMLRRTVDARRDALADAGAADLAELRARSDQPVPSLLVLVDDYAAFEERYERVESGRFTDLLRQLVSDGPAMGVHFVFTADRRASLPTAITSVLGLRLALRLADRDEYSRAGLSPKLAELDLPPGRGFLEDEREVQVGALGQQRGESLRDAMGRIAATLVETLPPDAQLPQEVGALPDRVARTPSDALEPWRAVIGVGETALQPVIIDLAAQHFVVAGPYRSGRSTALATVVRGVRESTPDVEIHLVAPRRTPLKDLTLWNGVHVLTDAPDLARLLEELNERSEATGTKALIVIDDATEVLDPTNMSGLDRLVRAARDTNVRVLISAEHNAIRQSFSPWHRELLKDGTGLLLDPNLELDGDMLGVKLPWRREVRCPPGRGFAVTGRGIAELVQVGDEPGNASETDRTTADASS